MNYVELIKSMIHNTAKRNGNMNQLAQLIVKLNHDCEITDDELVELVCEFYLVQFDK